MPEQDEVDSLQQYGQVLPERPVRDVRALNGQLLLEAQTIMSLRLPRPGDSLWDRKSEGRPARQGGDLTGEDRTRPNQAHLAAEHIDQLRQLVKKALPEEATDSRKAGTLPYFEEWRTRLVEDEYLVQHGVRAVHHGAEFEEGELYPFLHEALLPKENWAPAAHLDRNRDGQHQRTEEDQQAAGDPDVEPSLQPVLGRAQARGSRELEVELGEGRRCLIAERRSDSYSLFAVFPTGSAVSHTFVPEKTPVRRRGRLAGGLEDRRVDLDRKRTAEERDQDLYARGCVQARVKNCVHHPQRAALDDDALAASK